MHHYETLVCRSKCKNPWYKYILNCRPLMFFPLWDIGALKYQALVATFMYKFAYNLVPLFDVAFMMHIWVSISTVFHILISCTQEDYCIMLFSFLFIINDPNHFLWSTIRYLIWWLRWFRFLVNSDDPGDELYEESDESETDNEQD